jgi:two-component system LytT family response regulator
MKPDSSDEDRLRVMIIDDEPLGRQKIRLLLNDDPTVDVVGESAGGDDAVRQIRSLHPDLLFLDVQMPGKDGFAVLRELDQDDLPLVVFVTAYDQHAVEAFRVHALDYLLKPFDRERFLEALGRAREQIVQQRDVDTGRRLLTMLGSSPLKEPSSERLMLKTGGKIVFLRTGEIDWVEAQGDYVCLHAGQKKHLLREKISELEVQLPYHSFVRIHRSTIVNIDRIKEMQPLFYGEYSVVLFDGTRLTLSRSFREKVFQRLGPRA